MSSLPRSIQDLEAKERYGSSQRHSRRVSLRGHILPVSINAWLFSLFALTRTPKRYSRKAKEILNEYDLKTPYFVVEVDLREDAMDVKRVLGEKTGRDTFPNVFVHGTSIGGANELGRFHRSGRLREILVENKLL
ncbi:hypothetical protein BJV82DRAFT_517124 [Fennellomyces sp. T-0311]|nr:hypothetical protein BJV82DRAFT_517124 [Fennellomyces sp. T-0311]